MTVRHGRPRGLSVSHRLTMQARRRTLDFRLQAASTKISKLRRELRLTRRQLAEAVYGDEEPND